MSQHSATVDSSKFVKAEPLKRPRGSLRRKITFAFSVLILLLGLLVLAIVYYFTNIALQKQVHLRSNAIATNLADAAAGFVSRKSALDLDALVVKYGRLEGVAYAFLQGSKGEILASSMRPFPDELKDTGVTIAVSGQTRVRGEPVIETRSPILDGQLGTARVGLWAEPIQHELHSTLMPIIALIAACTILGILLSIMLARKTVRPIVDLTAAADDISRGHLETSLTIGSNDEIGELGRSVERMRASLRAAMIRLNRQ